MVHLFFKKNGSPLSKQTLKLYYLVLAAMICLFFFPENAHAQADTTLAKQLIQQADQAIKKENYDLAYEQYNKVANIYKQVGDWQKWYDAVLKNRKLLRNQGKHEAITAYITQQTNEALPKAGEQTVIGKLYAYIGIAYEAVGKYDSALLSYEKALTIFHKNDDEISFAATIYTNVGNIYTRRLDYDKAIGYLHKALKIYQKQESYSRVSGVHSDLGIAYHFQRDYQKSAEHYTLAIETPGVAEVQKASLMVNMAEAFREQGKPAKGIAACIKALSIFNGLTYKPYDKIAAAYATLGTIVAETGKWKEAIPVFEKALVAVKTAFGEQHREVAKIYCSLGDLYLKNEYFDEALVTYQLALKATISTFAPTNVAQNPSIYPFIPEPWIMTALGQKAKAYHQKYKVSKDTGDLQNALKCYDLSLEQAKMLQQSYRTEASKLNLVDFVRDNYENALEATKTLIEVTDNQELIPSAFIWLERSKSAVLLESMREFEARQFAEIPDSVLHLVNEVQVKIEFFKAKWRQTQQKATRQALSDSIFAFERKRDDFLKKIEEDFPQYQNFKQDADLAELNDVQTHLLDTHQALISYFMGKDALFTLLINKGKSTLFKSKIDTHFRQRIIHFRDSIASPNFTADAEKYYTTFTQNAHYFYQQLLAPVLADLPLSTNQLTIIPDNELWYIPFEALLTEPAKEVVDYRLGNLEYVLEKYSVSYAYSATLWKHNMQENKGIRAHKTWMAYAPFTTDQANEHQLRDCADNVLLPLGCSQSEVANIRDIVHGKTREGGTASKKEFYKNAHSYRVLHLATHACIEDEAPMENKIYFADDYLATYELYNMRLNAELAVLSACNTGSGKLASGEGVMSLSRGFAYAGCPSMLMSLWSVDDCATADIMVAFYRFLEAGLSKPMALQSAKLDYLQKAGKAAAHPFYWAAFVNLGNTEALHFPNWRERWQNWISAFIAVGIFISTLITTILLRKRQMGG